MSEYRELTEKQYREGYMTYANGFVMRHAYKASRRITRDGRHYYVVDEPEAPKPLDEVY